MAGIGLRHMVAATVTSHTDGAAPTYGTGKVIGKGIEANLTINRANNPLYADDEVAEDDNGITGIQVEFGLDELDEEVEAYLGLSTKITTGTGTDAVTTYRETSKAANDVGAGYVRVRMKNGTLKYQGVWIYSMKFSLNNETARTKGENIEWQTPTVSGNAKGLQVDSSGELAFRDKRIFEDYDDAVTWINGLANIT